MSIEYKYVSSHVVFLIKMQNACHTLDDFDLVGAINQQKQKHQQQQKHFFSFINVELNEYPRARMVAVFENTTFLNASFMRNFCNGTSLLFVFVAAHLLLLHLICK